MHTDIMLTAGEENLLVPTSCWLGDNAWMLLHAFMSVDGLLDCHIEEGNVDGDVFFQFGGYLPLICHLTGPILTVWVLDNTSIHHVDEVVELLHSLGALVLFLPPYLLDYNPIEAFSKVKSLIRDYEVDAEVQTINMQEIILTAFSKITCEDYQ